MGPAEALSVAAQIAVALAKISDMDRRTSAMDDKRC
jgi:hypothetical protein